MSEDTSKNTKHKIVMFGGTKDHQTSCKELLGQLDVKVLLPDKKQQVLQFLKGATAVVVQNGDTSLVKKLIHREFSGHILWVSKNNRSIVVGEKELLPLKEEEVITRLIQIIKEKIRTPYESRVFA